MVKRKQIARTAWSFLLAAVLLPLISCKHDVRLQALPALQSSGKAAIRVVLTFDRNNTLDVMLGPVPPPESFGPQYTRYVVWTQTPDGHTVNVGQVRIENGKGNIKTLTPARRFHVLVSVEENGDATRPGSLLVFKTAQEISW